MSSDGPGNIFSPAHCGRHALLGNRSAAQENAARVLVLAEAGSVAIEARARAVVAVITDAR